mmetsp:Transcript_3987/g.4973  ORF Transcript_3987/g.4973 Transcript_3987/m.4973 type:complete len:89 (-) Transcript_3987:1127-1393(-)
MLGDSIELYFYFYISALSQIISYLLFDYLFFLFFDEPAEPNPVRFAFFLFPTDVDAIAFLGTAAVSRCSGTKRSKSPSKKRMSYVPSG